MCCSDPGCSEEGGTCQPYTNPCDGNYKNGLCLGQIDTCCVPYPESKSNC